MGPRLFIRGNLYRLVKCQNLARIRGGRSLFAGKAMPYIGIKRYILRWWARDVQTKRIGHWGSMKPFSEMSQDPQGMVNKPLIRPDFRRGYVGVGVGWLAIVWKTWTSKLLHIPSFGGSQKVIQVDNNFWKSLHHWKLSNEKKGPNGGLGDYIGDDVHYPVIWGL